MFLFYSWVTTLAWNYSAGIWNAKSKQSRGRLHRNWTQHDFDSIVCTVTAVGWVSAIWLSTSFVLALLFKGGSLMRLLTQGWVAELCHVTSRDASSICALTIHLKIKRPSECKHLLNSLNWTGGSVRAALFSSLLWFSRFEWVFFLFVLLFFINSRNFELLL